MHHWATINRGTICRAGKAALTLCSTSSSAVILPLLAATILEARVSRSATDTLDSSPTRFPFKSCSSTDTGRTAPHAHPNALIVEHVDQVLGRQGRMVEALEAIGPGVMVAEGPVVELHLDGWARTCAPLTGFMARPNRDSVQGR